MWKETEPTDTRPMDRYANAPRTVYKQRQNNPTKATKKKPNQPTQWNRVEKQKQLLDIKRRYLCVCSFFLTFSVYFCLNANAKGWAIKKGLFNKTHWVVCTEFFSLSLYSYFVVSRFRQLPIRMEWFVHCCSSYGIRFHSREKNASSGCAEVLCSTSVLISYVLLSLFFGCNLHLSCNSCYTER